MVGNRRNGLIGHSQQDQQIPHASNQGSGGKARLFGNVANVFSELESVRGVMPFKGGEPFLILKNRGDFIGFAQALDADSANRAIECGGDHHFERAVLPFNPASHDISERRLLVVHRVNMEGILISSRKPAKLAGQLVAQAA